jgi:hypothetical protein
MSLWSRDNFSPVKNFIKIFSKLYISIPHLNWNSRHESVAAKTYRRLITNCFGIFCSIFGSHIWLFAADIEMHGRDPQANLESFLAEGGTKWDLCLVVYRNHKHLVGTKNSSNSLDVVYGLKTKPGIIMMLMLIVWWLREPDGNSCWVPFALIWIAILQTKLGRKDSRSNEILFSEVSIEADSELLAWREREI